MQLLLFSIHDLIQHWVHSITVYGGLDTPVVFDIMFMPKKQQGIDWLMENLLFEFQIRIGVTVFKICKIVSNNID